MNIILKIRLSYSKDHVRLEQLYPHVNHLCLQALEEEPQEEEQPQLLVEVQQAEEQQLGRVSVPVCLWL